MNIAVKRSVLSLFWTIIILVFASPITTASASYMSDCNKLINTWETCGGDAGSCGAEEASIVEECKCHAKKGSDWKLVTAAVGKDGVCNATIPFDDVPPPSEPRPIGGNTGKGSPNIEGNFEDDRGGPEEGNTGRGNPR